MASSSRSLWWCSTCTFAENELASTACTMCGTIAHAVEANSFSAKVQVLHHQRLQEEEAMVRVVCAVFQHLVFFLNLLTHLGQNLPNQRHIGYCQKALDKANPFSLSNKGSCVELGENSLVVIISRVLIIYDFLTVS